MQPAPDHPYQQPNVADVAHHQPPLIGCRKPAVTIANGVDPTQPACAEWPDLIDEWVRSFPLIEKNGSP